MALFAPWLADFQLLAAALLLGVMLAIALLRQPAQRLAVAKSTLVALPALALLCAIPGWSLVHLLNSPPTPAPVASPVPLADMPPAAPTPAPLPFAPVAAAASPIVAAIETTPTPPTTEPIDWPAAVVTLYATGCALVALWLVIGGLLARRVLSQATPAPPELEQLLAQITGPVARPPQLLISHHIAAPVAMGLRRPAILLPASTFPIQHSAFASSPTQLLPILAHEWAHLEHRDLHTLAATRLLLILLWPQPLFWLLRRTIRLDQETLADAAAADRAGRLDYAQQLLAWARTASTQRPPRLAGAVGLWEGPSQLKRRIAVLLNEKFNVMRSCSRRWKVLSIACIVSLALLLSLVTLQPAMSASEKEDQPVGSQTTKLTETDAEGSSHPNKDSDDSERQAKEVAERGSALVQQLAHAPNLFMGFCINEAGEPLAEVDVSLFVYEGATANENVEPIAHVRTGAGGKFEFNEPIDVAKEFPNGVPEDGFATAPVKIIAAVAKSPGLTTEFQNEALYRFVKQGQVAILQLKPAQKLMGRVTDDKGKPVADAVVSTTLSVGGYVPGANLSARTDVDGRYAINDLPRYDVDERARELAAARERKEPWAMFAPPGPAVSVQHSDFATRRVNLQVVPGELNLSLLPGSTVKGRVVAKLRGPSDESKPLANVPVWIMRTMQPIRDPNAAYGLVEQQQTTTDAEGNYMFTSLPASEYAVTATAPDLTTAGVTGIAVGVGQTTAAPDLVLTSGAIVRVRVLDAATKQLLKLKAGQKGCILPQRLTPGVVGAPRMDSQIANFSVDGVGEARLAPGRYGLFVSIPGEGLEPNFESHSPDGESTVAEFEVREGETLDLDVPLIAFPLQMPPGVTATVQPAVADSASVEIQTSPMPATGYFQPSTTPADGEHPGAVPVKPQAGIPAIDGSTRPETKAPATIYPVAAPETTHQTLGMGKVIAVPIEPPKHQPNTLQLHIVDENSKPVAGVEATLYSAASSRHEPKPIKTLLTDAAGNAIFADVVPADQIAKLAAMKAAGEFIYGSQGAYQIALKHPGRATALLYQSAGDLALAGVERTIMLRPAVKLSGRVTDPAGEPVADAVVTAGGFSGNLSIPGVNAVSTDAAGRFEFNDRAPFNRAAANEANRFMNYVTTAHSPGPQPAPAAAEDPTVKNVSDLVVTHPKFAVTRAEGGDVPGVADVQMLPAASIVGRVVHQQTGAPAAGVTVRAISEPTEAPQTKRDGDRLYTQVPYSHSAATQTDEQGAYRLANLPSGKYNLWIIEEGAQGKSTKLASRGFTGIAAVAGAEPTQAPDAEVGPPPTVNVQLVDAATGRPLPIDKELVATPMVIRADHPLLPQPELQRTPISKDGTFKFSALPGKFRIGVEVVEKPGTLYQVHYRSSDDFYNSAPVVDLNCGDDASVEVLVYPVAQIEQFRAEQSNAYKLVEAKKLDEAIDAFTKMIANRPQAYDPLSGRGYVYRLTGRYAEAIADADALLKQFPEDAQSKFTLADLLASSPIDGTRDGKRALRYAQELVAAARVSHPDPDAIARYLEFAAAAHAELGDFAKAVAVQQEAIAQAATLSTAGMESRLKLYQSNKPYRREPPALPAIDAPVKKPADQGAAKSLPTAPPLSTKILESPPGSPMRQANASRAVIQSADIQAVGIIDRTKPLSYSAWDLKTEPAPIDLQAPATLGDAVK